MLTRMSEQKPPSGKKSTPRADSPTPASSEGQAAAVPPPGSPQAPPSGTPAPDAAGQQPPGPIQNGSAPNESGQAAGQQGPAQGTGHGQQPGAWSSPNAPQQQAGYPPQQHGGYPPQPQQGGYPPQPQQGGYPPQQGGQPYPPGYPPQPGYPPRPGGPQPPRNYIPRAPSPATPPRPPLAPRQRRGAMLAGAVSFTLMTLGFTLIAIPLLIGVLGAFIGTIVSWAAQNDSDDFSVNGGPRPQEIESFISDAWSMFLPWLIGALILGIIIWILGYFSSLWILRSHRVHRPVAVTWSGLGIAVVGNFFLSALSSPVTGLFNVWDFDPGDPDDFRNFGGPGQMQWLDNVNLAPAALGLALLFLVISVVVNAAIGLLSWWWMAHAFREPAPSGREKNGTGTQNRPPAAQQPGS